MKSLSTLKQQAINAIASQPSVRQASRWYAAQNARDQLILKVLLWLLICLLTYLLFLSPALTSQQQIKNKLAKNVALYNLIAENAHRFGQVDLSNGQQTPLINLISQQAQQRNINLSRYEQSDNGVKIWLDNESFDKAISWLENLKSQSGILVKQIDVEQQSLAGQVSLRATLNR